MSESSEQEFSKNKGIRYSRHAEVYEPGDLVHAITYHNEPIGTVIHRKVSAKGAPLNHYDILVSGEMMGLHAFSLRKAEEMK